MLFHNKSSQQITFSALRKRKAVMEDKRDRGSNRSRDDKKKPARRDFVTNVLEVVGERGGEIFGAQVGGMLKNSLVAKVAQAFGASGISSDFVLNNLPYIAKLPILNDVFNDTAEGLLRGLAEHLKARMKDMPTDENAQKLWLSTEFDSFKGEAKKRTKTSTAAPQSLSQVVAGLDLTKRNIFDQIMLSIPEVSFTLTRDKAFAESSKRAPSELEVIAMIETPDPALRLVKFMHMLANAPLLNPPKTGLVGFLEHLEKQVMGEAEGLKPDGKHIVKFREDAKASAVADNKIADTVNHMLGAKTLTLRKRGGG